jgi:hypothetical protein
MPIIGIIASGVSAKEVLYYTASANYTPAAYPFNFDAYIVGGGGGKGGTYALNTDNFVSMAGGGGGGSGFFTLQQNITKNSGTIAITIGAAGNAGTNYPSGNTTDGNAGGTSTVDTYNAAGGGGGLKATGTGSASSGGGGNGGSGGGSGGYYIENFNTGAFEGDPGRRGGDSGGHGQNGNKNGGTGQNQNANTGNTNAYLTGNDARIPPGGSGDSFYGVNYAPAYNGITVSGSAYGAGRGWGQLRTGTGVVGGGFVIIKQN